MLDILNISVFTKICVRMGPWMHAMWPQGGHCGNSIKPRENKIRGISNSSERKHYTNFGIIIA